jgi:prolipoprotein diacylglyceryltransferase
MFRRAVVRMRFAILFVLVFAVLFRWYVGAGKDACSYGVGYGVFSLVCEVLRYFGEIVVIVFMSFIGACAGLSPFVIGACIFEYDEAFPDPEEATDAGADAGEVGHLKKE